MPGSVIAMMRIIVEKCVEEGGKELAQKVAEKFAEEGGKEITQKVVEKYLGDAGRDIAQRTMSILDAQMCQRVVDFTSQLVACLVGDKFEEFLHSTDLDLDEVPGNIAEWFNDKELVKIGREALGNLSVEARRGIQQAGYTSAQIGTAAVLHLNDLVDGYSEITRRLKGKLEG